MAIITKTIYRVNREWFKVEDKRVVGDLYWQVQVADDTLTTNIEELIKSLLNNLKDDIGIYYDKDDEEEFAIYSIEVGTGIIEVDDEDVEECEKEENLWRYDVAEWKTYKTFCCCTKEYADKLGIESDYFPIK